MKKKTSLKTQINVLLISIIICSLVIVSSINFFSTMANYKSDFSSMSENAGSRASDSISSMVKTSTEAINMLANDPNAKALFVNPDSEIWLNKGLDAYLSTHKDVTNVYMGLKNGKMLLVPAQKLPSDFDPRVRPWYKDAIAKDGHVIITEPYKSEGDNHSYTVTFAKTVKDISSGETIGVMALDIKLATLSEMVSKITIGENGFVAVMDGKSTIIAHKDSSLLGVNGEKEAWIKEVVASKEELQNKKVRGEFYNIAVLENKETGWKIAAFAPVKELTSRVAGVAWLTIIIALVLLAVAVTIGTLYTGRITKSIVRLNKVLLKVGEGNFTERVEEDRKSSREVSEITQSVNKMIDDMVAVLNNVLETSNFIRQSTEGLAAITEQSNAVGEEVAKAVQQISEGATDQANSLEDSVSITSRLGEEVASSLDSAEK